MWRRALEALIVGSVLVILLVAPAYTMLVGDRNDIENSQVRIEELENRVNRLEVQVHILTERAYGR